MKLFKESLKLTDGSQYSDIRKKILGFVGAYGSSISKAVASILKEFNFPQISYASTAAILKFKCNENKKLPKVDILFILH